MLCVCEVSFIHRHSNYYLMDKMGSMNKLKKRVSLGSSILIIATNFAQTIIFRFSLILIFKLRIQKIYPSLTHTLSLSLFISLSLSLSLSLSFLFTKHGSLVHLHFEQDEELRVKCPDYSEGVTRCHNKSSNIKKFFVKYFYRSHTLIQKLKKNLLMYKFYIIKITN